MITGNVKLDMRALHDLCKNAIKRAERAAKPMADKLVDDIKNNAPQLTGALRDSIAAKCVTKGSTALAIVGPDINYMMQWMGNIVKEPYSYAEKEDALTHFMAQTMPDVDELAAYVAQEFSK